MSDGINISPEGAAIRGSLRGLVNPIQPLGVNPQRRQKHMNEPKEPRLADKAPANSQDTSTPKTWKKRWHFQGLIVVMSLGMLMIAIYLLRSVLFPNYVGLLVALCVVAFGLFLVRGVIRMLLEFDKLEEAEIKKNEFKDSPPETNVVDQKTGVSARAPEINQKLENFK